MISNGCCGVLCAGRGSRSAIGVKHGLNVRCGVSERHFSKLMKIIVMLGIHKG